MCPDPRRSRARGQPQHNDYWGQSVNASERRLCRLDVSAIVKRPTDNGLLLRARHAQTPAMAAGPCVYLSPTPQVQLWRLELSVATGAIRRRCVTASGIRGTVNAGQAGRATRVRGERFLSQHVYDLHSGTKTSAHTAGRFYSGFWLRRASLQMICGMDSSGSAVAAIAFRWRPWRRTVCAERLAGLLSPAFLCAGSSVFGALDGVEAFAQVAGENVSFTVG
jgi:hypothetical protein